MRVILAQPAGYPLVYPTSNREHPLGDVRVASQKGYIQPKYSLIWDLFGISTKLYPFLDPRRIFSQFGPPLDLSQDFGPQLPKVLHFDPHWVSSQGLMTDCIGVGI